MLRRYRQYFTIIYSIFCGFLLVACTSMQVNHTRPIGISNYQKMVVLPFTNLTETPQADDRAAAMTADLLRAKGMKYVVSYPIRFKTPSLIPGAKTPIPRSKLIAFARHENADFAMIGEVTEWNYKVGLDGEPAVGINLEIINVHNEQVIWSAAGSKTGGSRTALSEVALTLINYMLNSVQ